jgi:hypothetical protein
LDIPLEFPQSSEQSPRDSRRLKRESPEEVRIEAVIVETRVDIDADSGRDAFCPEFSPK